MNTELIIDVRTSEVALALLEDKQLVELNKEKSSVQFSVGDIYLGKVKKIMPGLNAAFVDVGYEKDAFLHYLDLGPNFKSFHRFVQTAQTKKGKTIALPRFRLEPEIDKNGKIADILNTGQTVLVQIAKEPISTKGPRLSSEISIAGRHIVLLPFSDKVSISQKISSPEERKRLKRLLESIIPKNYGAIIRTAAEGKKVAILDTELRSLVKKWETAYARVKANQIPSLILGELKRTSAIIRDMLNMSFNSIYVNDDAIFNDIKEYISTIAPEKEKIVKLYNGKVPIFENFGIEKQIKGLFGKTVSFKSGAYLIIEHTEALHAIDVNSGNRSKAGNDQETNALEVNLAAAQEIQRQLRLRDMGGIIVIDFIDMHDNENRQMLYDRMRELMSSDRAKHNILPLSKFGLMQITRQRVRPEMHIETTEKCPTCQGTGKAKPTLLLDEEIESRIDGLTQGGDLKKLIVKVHPFVAAFLTKGMLSKRYKWSKKYKCNIEIQPISSYNFMDYRFFDEEDKEIFS